jgi:hypothetical protein
MLDAPGPCGRAGFPAKKTTTPESCLRIWRAAERGSPDPWTLCQQRARHPETRKEAVANPVIATKPTGRWPPAASGSPRRVWLSASDRP